MTTFEAFKDANDEKLAEIERRLGADVVTTDKVERISRRSTSTSAGWTTWR